MKVAHADKKRFGTRPDDKPRQVIYIEEGDRARVTTLKNAKTKLTNPVVHRAPRGECEGGGRSRQSPADPSS